MGVISRTRRRRAFPQTRASTGKDGNEKQVDATRMSASVFLTSITIGCAEWIPLTVRKLQHLDKLRRQPIPDFICASVRVMLKLLL